MNAFALKLLALVAMMIDHTGSMLTPIMDANLLRVIGRLSFPIYAFFIAEGCLRTRDIKKYIFRLFLFALVSEIPFDLLFANVHGLNGLATAALTDFSDQNVFFTLTFGAVCIWLFQIAQKNGNLLCLFGILGCVALGYFGRTDYGAAGVIFIFFLYLARRRALQAVVIVLASFYFYVVKFNSLNVLEPSAVSAVAGVFTSFSYSARLFMGGCLSVLPISLYNRQSGPRFKWGFYVSYPLHLLLLAVVWFFYISPAFEY